MTHSINEQAVIPYISPRYSTEIILLRTDHWRRGQSVGARHDKRFKTSELSSDLGEEAGPLVPTPYVKKKNPSIQIMSKKNVNLGCD